MTLKDLYRLAIEQGGDAVSRALGHAEAQLARNPGHRQALMYKGSLLTMVGDQMLTQEKRRAYIRTGVALMDSAMASDDASPAVMCEMTYVQASTLACLPGDLGLDRVALEALRELAHSPCFDATDPFDRVRTLVLLSCLAKHFGQQQEAQSRFRQARGIDEDLAIRTYSAWLNRSSPDTSVSP
ncbi:hypothetical protein [Tropicibacter oceani]|uniref:Tetratrico peptide repeat group 5 domain-containing protein n=1 Tax=Tropicibacter oceani TaxID=3058420 RepID=A0ABY8QIT5_9RHOB|nr:hypothetical protein [Tropicibacter oceani]WGW04530.1 hypothetical protein QF118_02975 [Tropicibacter oceani]